MTRAAVDFSRTLVLAFVIVATSAKEISIDSCYCWPGFEAKSSDGGKTAECVAIFYKQVMDCNMPQPPPCQCTDNANGIAEDSEGYWYCTKSYRGRVWKKWPCENVDDWNDYWSIIRSL